jgi:hypothetical protein
MIKQFRVLQKVKKLREDKAMRALQKARATLREAEERRAALARDVQASAETLPQRERDIYAAFMRTPVGMEVIEEAKENVLHLRADHQKLVDRRDRAADHVVRCEQALAAARKELRTRQQDCEKIDTVTDELVLTAETDATAREEIEIEDAFSRPKPRPGDTVGKAA